MSLNEDKQQDKKVSMDDRLGEDNGVDVLRVSLLLCVGGNILRGFSSDRKGRGPSAGMHNIRRNVIPTTSEAIKSADPGSSPRASYNIGCENARAYRHV